MELHMRLPGTTANLGPGFDALGLALTIYNRMTIHTRSEPGIHITTSGEGAQILATGKDNLLYQAALFTAKRVGKALPGLDVHMQNHVPLARGLGSSSTAIVGGVILANRLLDHPFSQDECLNIATQIEGHPDNVSPCLFGGLTLSTLVKNGVDCVHVLPPEGLRVVVVIPQFELKTKAARHAMPEQVSIEDAVFNISRACFLAGALITGAWDRLKTGMQDRLHQPYRAQFIPAFENVLSAATDAGALGAALSGAGPTVMAFVKDQGDVVGCAMVKAWQCANITSQYHVLDIDPTGATFE